MSDQPKPTAKQISERAARERMHGRSITILAPLKPKPTGERKQGHSSLRMKDGKLQTFDPHPLWKWEHGDKGFQLVSDAHNAALAEATDAAVQEMLLVKQQLAAEREKSRHLNAAHDVTCNESAATIQKLRKKAQTLMDALKDIRVGAPDIVKQQIKDALKKVEK